MTSTGRRVFWTPGSWPLDDVWTWRRYGPPSCWTAKSLPICCPVLTSSARRYRATWLHPIGSPSCRSSFSWPRSQRGIPIVRWSALASLGLAALEGRPAEAVEAGLTALALDPLQDEALMVVAEGWEQQGDVERAIEWYERYFETLPDSASEQRRALEEYIEALRRQY